MRLEDLIPAPITVNVGRGSVEVRGLTLTHIGVLLSKYGQELAPVFSEDSDPDFSVLLSVAPALCSDLIAMAIGAEDQLAYVELIPLSAKLDILMGTWKLSVLDPKGLAGKLRELARDLQKANQQAS